MLALMSEITLTKIIYKIHPDDSVKILLGKLSENPDCKLTIADLKKFQTILKASKIPEDKILDLKIRISRLIYLKSITTRPPLSLRKKSSPPMHERFSLLLDLLHALVQFFSPTDKRDQWRINFINSIKRSLDQSMRKGFYPHHYGLSEMQIKKLREIYSEVMNGPAIVPEWYDALKKLEWLLP